MTVLPELLTSAITGKRAILFLGAGASIEAKNAKGESPPDANQLRDIIARKFFRRDIPNRDVMAVAEMAIASAEGQPQVFEAVRQAFEGYLPSDAHKLSSTFNWRMIATTNYDLLLETAYSESKNKVQNLVPFVKDDEPVQEKLQATFNPVQYLKLHGSLDHIHDNDIPLILSREQYAAYSKNRTRLFGRLNDLAHESTLIFVGYRLDDPHIRELIYKLESSRRPRWYIVTPDAEDYDVNFWASKNVEVVKARFGEFMETLDSKIPTHARVLSLPDVVATSPIRRFFTTATEESAKVRLSLDADLTFVHAGMRTAEQIPQQFYSGYDTGWGAIIGRLDVRRKIEDDLLYSTLLENENPSGPILILLQGTAGAGKTIALKRTAFEAATASDALVLWLNESGALHPDVFAELYDLSKKPIYLFVDQIALRVDAAHSLLVALRSKKIPLVVVAAEREADWTTYCGKLDDEFSPKLHRIGNLSRVEVEGLLDLLVRHNSLGLLRELPREAQVEAFMEESKADRQLLVALHELTQGKPFEEIVLGEHQRIFPEQARQLYLDIATMHQFKVKVRAGTISRISGIRFEDYKEKFFEPLKSIVRVTTDPYTGDYHYQTRHPRVASIVFRQVCPEDSSKARQFARLIEGLDVGYSSDHRALEEMIKGRALVETFTTPDAVRSIYQAAIVAAPNQAFLYQQWAIFESNHVGGSLDLAEEKAAKARELDPHNRTVIHTQAEIDRKRANFESSPLLKETLRRRARERLAEMPRHGRFVTSSRCKLLVDEVADLSAALSEESKPYEIGAYADKISDAELALLNAQQQFPDDADIIEVEARLRDILKQEERALAALERAWAAKPRGSGIAIRISRAYNEKGRRSDALNMLKSELTRLPDDKPLHHATAMQYLGDETFDTALGGVDKMIDG